MPTLEQYKLMNDAMVSRREQNQAVAAAILKLQMMGLTPETGMVECVPPANIDPLRWKAMIRQAFKNPDIVQD